MTDTFTHENQLKTTPHVEAILDVRMEASRNLCNACLQELLWRFDLMQELKAYRAARILPKGEPRNEAFNACQHDHGFLEYALHFFAAKTCKACWIADHIDSLTIRKTATRAFDAVIQYMFGKRGRTRYKRKGWFTSVEGKSNSAGVRWRDRKVLWSGLTLMPIFDSKDKHGVEAHALSCLVKCRRLVKRTINGKVRWSEQLVLRGMPHQKTKNVTSGNTCGLDIGPSIIAAVSNEGAFLAQFCEEVVHPWKEISREQRAQDRSRRATKPDNYKEDGTIKKGTRKWHRSNRYKKRQKRIAQCQRALAAARKKQHGEMCNNVLSFGKVIKTEKLSYKSFHKNFGHSVTVRAPGMFIKELTRKTENAGRSVEEISTRKTKLPQSCICGSVVKKPLKQRHHACSCCVEAQRDLFLAHLARHSSNNALDISQAKVAWPAAEPLQRRAMSRITETASRGPQPASFSISRRQSCSPVENGSITIKTLELLPKMARAKERWPVLPLEPPGVSPWGGSAGRSS
jgi:transposase